MGLGFKDFASKGLESKKVTAVLIKPSRLRLQYVTVVYGSFRK